MMRVRTFSFITIVVVASLVACGGRWWERQHVVGPDGTREWLVVRCRVHSDCYEHVGPGCPQGYEITRDTPEGRHGGYVLAHCITGAAVPTPATKSAPPPGATTPATMQADPWAQ